MIKTKSIEFDLQFDPCWCFIMNLLMQHKLCCVNPIGRYYKRYMIKASLGFGLYLRHSNFNSLQRCRIYKVGLLLNPNGQKMHHNLTQTSLWKEYLQQEFKIDDFALDHKSAAWWLPRLLRMKWYGYEDKKHINLLLMTSILVFLCETILVKIALSYIWHSLTEEISWIWGINMVKQKESNAYYFLCNISYL